MKRRTSLRVRRWGVFSIALVAFIPLYTLIAVGALYAWRALDRGTDFMPYNGAPALFAWCAVPFVTPIVAAWLIRRRLVRREAK